jgi:hypothetical protein
MESEATHHARPSRLGIYLVALTLAGTLFAGGACGDGSTGSKASAVIDTQSGYPSGSIEDQQIRAFLEQSGYEGGGTVVEVTDLITGYVIGTSEDQRIRSVLMQSGFGGGGTAVRPAAPEMEQKRLLHRVK